MKTVAGVQAFSNPGRGENARIGIALCHGFTGSPTSMLDWAEHLAAQGYAVRLPLLPGHGTHWSDLAATEWRMWSAAFEREYVQLAADTDKTFVAGLSMGGTLALRVAAAHPVAGVAVVNPALSFTDPRARFARWLKYIKRTVPAIADDIKKLDITEGAYDLTPVAAVHQLQLLFRDTRALLPSVTAPTVVFRSSTDRVVSDASVRMLEQRLGSDSLEVLRLRNSYHVATMDHEAQTIFDRTDEFIHRTLGRNRND